MPPEEPRRSVAQVWSAGGRVLRRSAARVGTLGAQVLLAPERAASRQPPTFGDLRWQAASAAQADDPRYLAWVDELEHPRESRYHRKVWEWCFILEAMRQSGLMVPGGRALGFGVGQERIPAILASRGLEVVATDQPLESAGDWVDSGQHAAALEALRYDDVCPPERFRELVSFRPVDMCALPADLTGFDLLWSSCAFEHLGGPVQGEDFVLRSLRCLRPGGVAIHTTELRVEGRDDADLGGTVLFSVPTMERLLARLRLRGHRVRANFRVAWDSEADRFVDEPPYTHVPYHLKLRVAGHVTTSFGLIVTKRGR